MLFFKDFFYKRGKFSFHVFKDNILSLSLSLTHSDAALVPPFVSNLLVLRNLESKISHLCFKEPPVVLSGCPVGGMETGTGQYPRLKAPP